MSYKFYRENNFKETELGPLPEEWKVAKLIRLSSF